jgi:magnesium transporter
MITYYFRTIKDDALKELEATRTGVWVHVVAPTNDEITRLIRDFALDVNIMEDAQDYFEVPRLERSQGASYFFTRYPYPDQKEGSDTAPLLIVMGESFVLTFVLREVPQFSQLFDGTKLIVTTQKAKLFIQIMEVLTKAYDSESMYLRKAVQKDRARLRKIGPREIERLVSYETKLNNMVDALIPTNTWLQQVTSGNFMQLYSDDINMMEDLVIANNQVVNSARSILKTIQNIRGSIEAIMTSRLNNTLSTLTVLTILLTVPLVISSLYGMNVPLPFQTSVYAFPTIIAVNILTLTFLGYIFRRKNWF